MPGRRNVKAAPMEAAFVGEEKISEDKPQDRPTELDLLRVEVVLLKRQVELLKEFSDFAVPFGKPHFDRWLAQYKDGARWQE